MLVTAESQCSHSINHNVNYSVVTVSLPLAKIYLPPNDIGSRRLTATINDRNRFHRMDHCNKIAIDGAIPTNNLCVKSRRNGITLKGKNYIKDFSNIGQYRALILHCNIDWLGYKCNYRRMNLKLTRIRFKLIWIVWKIIWCCWYNIWNPIGVECCYWTS